MVVVDSEAEAEPVDRLCAVGHDVQPTVRSLACECSIEPTLRLENRCHGAIAECPCGVAGSSRRERERIGASRPDHRLEHPLHPRAGARRTLPPMPGKKMRATWDTAAASDVVDRYVGDPATARAELDGLFGRLGDDPRGGTCVEVGCGPGRMTSLLAERFDRVVAVDVSPGMLAHARTSVPAANVDFRLVSGTALDSVEGGIADVLLCYLVLQHLPARRVVLGYLREFGRVLAPGGRAFVQLPVLGQGMSPRAWRAARSVVVPFTSRFHRQVEGRAAYRGTRLTDSELAEGLAVAGLEVRARDESPTSPYRHAREVFLRLERLS